MRVCISDSHSQVVGRVAGRVSYRWYEQNKGAAVTEEQAETLVTRRKQITPRSPGEVTATWQMGQARVAAAAGCTAAAGKLARS